MRDDLSHRTSPNKTTTSSRKEYLSVPELAEQIPYAPGTIRNMMSAGVFLEGVHYTKPAGKKAIFKWSAVERWIDTGGHDLGKRQNTVSNSGKKA